MMATNSACVPAVERYGIIFHEAIGFVSNEVGAGVVLIGKAANRL
jgi:hypothetical protein